MPGLIPGNPWTDEEREEAAQLYKQGISVRAISAKLKRHVKSVNAMLAPFIEPETLEREANRRRKVFEARFSDILVTLSQRVIDDHRRAHASAINGKRLRSGLDLLSCLGRVQSLLKPPPESKSQRHPRGPITYTPNDIEPAPTKPKSPDKPTP